MGKLLRFLDDNIVKIGIAFLLVFTTLYPKLPSVHIIRTYVYIRLEDFFIAAVVIIWGLWLIRGKIKLPPLVLSFPIYLYWFVGLICLILSLLIYGPTTLGFFPHLASLEYLRRIEYMILFLVAFATIKSKKDVRDYFIILVVTVILISLYGTGQKFYGLLWVNFPAIQHSGFCFPSFQTGNEEFAKGFHLCLPSDGRITSTFAGSYDLSAYMVFVIPILLTVLSILKKWKFRIVVGGSAVLAIMILVFTASRVSFIAYLVGVSTAFVLFKRKLFLIPVLVVSVILLLIFSSSTIKRFEQTIRFTSIVTDSQGQVIGEISSANLKGKKPVIKGNLPTQLLPAGSVVIGLPTKTTATTSATISKNLTPEEARALRLQNGGYQLSAVKGSFLIQKALTLDISFTTRFQAEWPRAWNAFLRDPYLGTGFSTLTLATDGDYLRALGESGIFGLVSFLGIFLLFGIVLSEIYPYVTSRFHKALLIGASGGMGGLLVNAIFIDVFEASKVAENLWMILGICFGATLLYKQNTTSYAVKFKSVFLSSPFYAFYLFAIMGIVYIRSLNNFFVADDFTWLHWAANTTFSGVIKYFTNSINFFYRPLDKTIIFGLYTLFSFNSLGFHLFTLLLHYLATIAVFFIAKRVFNKKFLAFGAAVLFLLLPSQAENIYWIATISTTLSAVFILFGLLFVFKYNDAKSFIWYVLAVFFGVCALLSYEISVVYPLLVVLVDTYCKRKISIKNFTLYIPFFSLIPLYYAIRIATHAFSGGGDYSYNFLHFLPNLAGNIFGYFGLFVFGERFIAINNTLRASFKSEIGFVLVLIVVIILLFAYVFLFYKKEVKKIVFNSFGSDFLFAVLFAVIALLPFAGLGNIAERYGYLSSVGFVLLLVLIINTILASIPLKQMPRVSLFIIIIGLLGVFYASAQITAEKEWETAGKITKDTMTAFRLDFQQLNNHSNVYLVSLPIKYKNAWVFPLGVRDSLWFIYRDNLPNFYTVNSIDTAKQQTYDNYNNKYSNDYIFSFDKNEYIYKVK